jgi:hypothetical protein
MNYNIIFRVCLTVSIAGLLSGCEKMLEVKPQSSITEETYFKNEGDFEPYVTGIYTQMRSFANNITYGTERGEELIVASNARFSTAWNHILSPTTGSINYNGWYAAIGHCNLLLDKMRGFNFTNAGTRSRIMAEAYALRAWFYYDLVKVIGDAPIILVAVVDENVPLLPRSPAADVVKQILSDVDSSLLLFKSVPGFSAAAYPSSKYRFAYASSLALKADVQMWSGKVTGGGTAALNDAISIINEIETTGIRLNTSFRDVVGLRATSNPEVLISSYFNRDETGSTYAVNALPFQAIVSGAANIDSLPWAANSGNAQGAFQISTQSRALFSANWADRRIPFTWVQQRAANGTLGIAWITKFPGIKYSDDRFPDNDVIIYRWADMLLLRAEARAALGNSAACVQDLNLIRARAGNPNYAGPTDKLSLEREVLNERGRELFFENKRWFDLVRFHSGGTINVYTFVPNLVGKTTPLFWPLNATVLANNTKLKQTTGY